MPKKSITAEVNELRTMCVGDLVARYEELFGRRPRTKNRQHLWRRCAWKEQERRLGGLSGAARRRLDELIAELDLPLEGRTERADVGRHRHPNDPPIGTTLSRMWKGTEIRATAVEGGWECDGIVHRSLSAVAGTITGSHVSGPAFFGLTKRSRGLRMRRTHGGAESR